MKKILLVGVSTVLLAGIAQANLTWAYFNNLIDWDATIQEGWLVQMYHDVNGDSVDLSTIRFDEFGATEAGVGHSDDVLLGSFTALLQDGKAGMQWGEGFTTAQWGALEDQFVYSVLFNAATIAGATQAVVIDESIHQLGSDSAVPHDYILGSVSGTWQVIPEPATALMLIIGGMGAFIFRRSKLKAQQEEEA